MPHDYDGSVLEREVQSPQISGHNVIENYVRSVADIEIAEIKKKFEIREKERETQRTAEFISSLANLGYCLALVGVSLATGYFANH